jgi:protein-tyrosine phosphatase
VLGDVIDLHCHVLPGIDDGPRTLEGSLELARAASAAGIDTLVATPHVSSHYPNDAATIARAREQLVERLGEERIALTVLAGAEIAITHVPEIDAGQLSLMGLGGGPWLLVEPPFALVAPGLERMLVDLRRRGHRIVLAHPERCPVFQRDHGLLESLVEAGMLVSITAGSLTGSFGGDVRRYALELVHRGLVHNVTSDAHDLRKRPPGLSEALAQAELGPLAEWLTRAVPEAILAGRDIPERPAQAAPTGRGRWLGLLGRG